MPIDNSSACTRPTAVVPLTARFTAAAPAVSPRMLWALTPRNEVRAIRIARGVRHSLTELRCWIDGRQGAQS